MCSFGPFVSALKETQPALILAALNYLCNIYTIRIKPPFQPQNGQTVVSACFTAASDVLCIVVLISLALRLKTS